MQKTPRHLLVTVLAIGVGWVDARVVIGADRVEAAAAPGARAAAPPLPAPPKHARRERASAPQGAFVPAPGAPAASASAPPAGDGEFNSCRKVPAGRRVVKLNLKPDADLADLVAWISFISCRPFILPASIASTGKKVTIVAPRMLTAEEAYRVFLDALDSLGLTVEPVGKFSTIIETAKAKSASIPLYGWDGLPLTAR